MSRPLRIEFAGAYYHVTAWGNERKKIFISQRDYARFKEYLEVARELFGWEPLFGSLRCAGALGTL